jgi:hypothetical protein
MRKHPRQSERHLLRELVAMHRNLKAVAEIDVRDLARFSLQHYIRRVAITEPENVPNHAVDGK